AGARAARSREAAAHEAAAGATARRSARRELGRASGPASSGAGCERAVDGDVSSAPVYVKYICLRQDERHRPVVDELDVHARTEGTGLDTRSECAQRVAENPVEGLSLLLPRGPAEARPVALRGVGDQRELADDQRLAADVE